MDDFCCEECTRTAAEFRAALEEAQFVLRAALLVREAEDYLQEVAS